MANIINRHVSSKERRCSVKASTAAAITPWISISVSGPDSGHIDWTAKPFSFPLRTHLFSKVKTSSEIPGYPSRVHWRSIPRNTDIYHSVFLSSDDRYEINEVTENSSVPSIFWQ